MSRDGGDVYQQRRLTLPSYVISLMVHACLLIVAFSSIGRYGDRSIRPVEGEELAEVGLYLREDPAVNVPTAPETAEAEQVVEQPAAEAVTDVESPDVDAVEPFLELPPDENSLNLLGAGNALPLSSPQSEAATQPNRPGEVTDRGELASPPVGALGPGETEFFNIREKAISLVYVLDGSVSMSWYNAIGVAKQELMSSLQHLDSKQKFQVIFYNEHPYPFLLKGDGVPRLYPATSVNRTLAHQFIENRQPDLSTEHLSALRLALQLKPDAIFFLTDAGEPIMTTPQLQQIRQMNNGNTRINCIEFGERAEVSRNNFLKRLAAENGGTYRYRDITRFKADR